MLLSWFILQSSLCWDKGLVTPLLRSSLLRKCFRQIWSHTSCCFVSSNITFLSLPSLPYKDIIRQPSEDEIIKLAPPPKKAWGGNRKHWSLHLGFFAPTNRPTPLLPHLSRNDTHTKKKKPTHPQRKTNQTAAMQPLPELRGDEKNRQEGKKSEDGKNSVGVWGESQRSEWVRSEWVQPVNCLICDAVFMQPSATFVSECVCLCVRSM